MVKDETEIARKGSVHFNYGFIVKDIDHSRNKRTYKVRDIFTGEEKWHNKGHLIPFFKPLLEPKTMMESEETRIRELDHDLADIDKHGEIKRNLNDLND